MALRLTMLARVLARRTTLDDLTVSLLVVECALRLLRLVTWIPAEKRVTGTLVAMVADTRWAVWRLSCPPRRSPADNDAHR
jgi:hypothetical protein